MRHAHIETETTQVVSALQAELEGIKDSMRRELSTHKGKLGEAENKLSRKDNALQQAQATLWEREEALQRKGQWCRWVLWLFLNAADGQW